MQVALATLWSCFPVSASGADVLLFSLLHTSSGSCCPETNHGLLRSSCSPFFSLSLSLSLCFLSPLYLSLLTTFFFLSGSLQLCLSLTRSASLWSRQRSPPSVWASRVPRGREEARTSAKQPSWEKTETGDLSLSLLLTLSLSVQLILFPWKRCSQSSHTEPLPG